MIKHQVGIAVGYQNCTSKIPQIHYNWNNGTPKKGLIFVTQEHIWVNHNYQYINRNGFLLVYDINKGFVLEENLVREDHIEGICDKLRRVIYFFKSSSFWVAVTSVRHIFHFVHSILAYSINGYRSSRESYQEYIVSCGKYLKPLLV